MPKLSEMPAAKVLKSTWGSPTQKTIFVIENPIITEDTVATNPGTMKL